MGVAVDVADKSMADLTTSPVHSRSMCHARVEAVHSLRGLAALSVALFHFVAVYPSLPAAIGVVGRNGWLGVDVFFVISGFILPYSLWRAGYRLSPSNFERFIWKRIVRLEPPYFVTIALILFLAYLSAHTPGYRGEPFHVDLLQLVLHVGYLNAFVGMPWLDPAFWTLAIECQFYLLIALVFPLVVTGSRTIRLVSIGSLLAVSVLSSSDHFVISFLPLFICGMVAFQIFSGLCKKWEAALVLVPAAALLWVHLGAIVMVVGLATAVVIVVVPSWTSPPLAFLGTLSYSIYLLHVPVGGRVINLARRLPQSTPLLVLSILAATAVSVLAAYALYRLVEKPAQQYAGSLRFDQEYAGSLDKA